MATTINTEFDSIYLTAHLPEEIEYETDQASLEVSVFVNASKVFSSVYYPYQKVVVVRDIRSIIETAMADRQLSFSTLKIVAAEPTNKAPTVTYDEDGNMHMTFDDATPEPVTETVEGIKVIYSRYKTVDDSEGFLSCNFLTSRKSALIPRSCQLKLSNYTKAYAQGSNYALIYYSHRSVSGQVNTYKAELGKMQSTSEKIVTVNLTHQSFKSSVDQALNTNCVVHGVEYHIGMRQFNIYFTDEEPTGVFSFRNAFNVEEIYSLFGATTIKTEVDRSEAVCGHKTQFYDETVKVKHEVETAPLSYDDAKWLNQMLTSKLVKRRIEDGSYDKVLISDITSEVTDSDKELIRLKFSWKYADGNEWL